MIREKVISEQKSWRSAIHALTLSMLLIVGGLISLKPYRREDIFKLKM